MTRRLAPAKINLALHLTSRRDDGFHLLDSIVCFADVGDYVSVGDDPTLSLSVTGPAAASVPVGRENLVLKAAKLLSQTRGARVLLEKHLPVAAGIGGGSADAAVALDLLARHWGCEVPTPQEVAAGLGADVPVCLVGHASRVRGIGDVVDPIASLPAFHAVLVNPGKRLATGDVFGGASKLTGSGLEDMPRTKNHGDWIDYLSRQRNDLQSVAVSLVSEISVVLQELGGCEGCCLARMSGSGATCFGLFDTAVQAQNGAKRLGKIRPDWWVMPARLA